jgi:hypothetical protein
MALSINDIQHNVFSVNMLSVVIQSVAITSIIIIVMFLVQTTVATIINYNPNMFMIQATNVDLIKHCRSKSIFFVN